MRKIEIIMPFPCVQNKETKIECPKEPSRTAKIKKIIRKYDSNEKKEKTTPTITIIILRTDKQCFCFKPKDTKYKKTKINKNILT